MLQRCSCLLVVLALVAAAVSPGLGAEPASLDRPAELQQRQPEFIAGSLGVTRQGTPIDYITATASGSKRANTAANLVTPDTDELRLVIVNGLDGSRFSYRNAWTALDGWRNLPPTLKRRVRLTVVLCANPDGAAAGTGPGNASGGNPTVGYPPQGDAYSSPTDPEAAYLWRWLGLQGPHAVIVVADGEQPGWFKGRQFDSGTFAGRLAARLSAKAWDGPSDALAPQLCQAKPANLGSIPAFEYRTNNKLPEDFMSNLVSACVASQPAPSEAGQELARRLSRTPLEVANELAKVYGHDLSTAVYVPAVALIGRLRLAELTGEQKHRTDVEAIVAPYYDGKKESLPERASASHLSGHLIFTELARLYPAGSQQRQRYLELAAKPANLAFAANGQPRQVLPYHNEMSDAVFMGCPILAHVGQLSGDSRYYDACLRQLRFMKRLCLRDDGLYRHSPLDEAAWGRGNGFPALGLALTLDVWPADQPGRDEVLKSLRAHLKTLFKYQDENGMWHQVIDHPESYAELTSTCMITYAMLRALRNGWMPEDNAELEARIRRAWNGLLQRIGSNGDLIDVCTSTGKQPDLRSYYDRTAILGRDGRGGAMALLVATELAALEKSRSAK